MEAPETIYLIKDYGDGWVWCDDPAPGEGMSREDAVEYVRKDCTYRQSPCKTACEKQAFEIEIKNLKSALGGLFPILQQWEPDHSSAEDRNKWRRAMEIFEA